MRTPTGAHRTSPDGVDFSQDALEQLRAALTDRYLIERELGRGGMAIVYLARDLRHNRGVAVKVLLPEIAILLGPDRFLREIEITAQLQHPNIIPVHDSGSEGGLLYYVMPFIEGESLRNRLAREQQLSLDNVLQITREVGAALSYAHQRGIVHRDIKPENILLSDGHAQVADFGIARAVSAAGLATLTQSGAVIGTPAYMAPEQAAGLPDIDGRADIYALAAVAHEALVGNRGDPMAAVRTSENLLTRSRPDISVPVAKALSSPLALERELRPPTVDAWIGSIERARRGRSVPMWAAVGMVVVAVLAVIAGWWLRSTGNRQPPEVQTRRIAVLPLATDGNVPASAIHNAVSQQLLYLPDAELLTDTNDATEFVRIQAQAGTDSIVELTLQVIDAASRAVVTTRSGTGTLGSLPSLVSEVLANAYASQVAEAAIGWHQALPARTETWDDYLRGENRFRAGDYTEAARLFDRVIENEPTYAPAHFKRLLTEVLRNRPTRATEEVDRILARTGEFRAALDPTTQEMLDGYMLLLRDGDLNGAVEQFARVAERNPSAIDAWFVLGFLRVNFAGLLHEPPTAARRDFERALALDEHFAAALAQLARIAWLQDRDDQASAYVGQYVKLDSTSATAEVLRVADSAAQSSAGSRARILLGLEARDPSVLELIAFVSGSVEQPYQDRMGSRAALDELWDQATTQTDRLTAFRMLMASNVGGARFASADSLLSAARRRGVPSEEIDLWLVLPEVTIGRALGTEGQRAEAARRLAGHDDPTALWLAARWHASRAPDLARRLTDRLAAIAQGASPTGPLPRSLWLDLQAHEALAAGDTATAVARWREATSRYQVTQVPLAPVASLWPLELSRARVALARRDVDEVLRIQRRFRYMAGFVDQVAWPAIWHLATAAHLANDDPLGAREIVSVVEPVFREANGSGVAGRDSLLTLGGVTR